MAFFSLTFIPQALNLPQLSRQEGWLLYLHATGSFSLKGARGCVTICRVVELREARTRDQTGSLALYNQIAAMLPQETRVYFAR